MPVGASHQHINRSHLDGTLPFLALPNLLHLRPSPNCVLILISVTLLMDTSNLYTVPLVAHIISYETVKSFPLKSLLRHARTMQIITQTMVAKIIGHTMRVQIITHTMAANIITIVTASTSITELSLAIGTSPAKVILLNSEIV